MKMKIVGIQDQNYEFDGYKFDGYKLHCVDVETEETNLSGNLVTNIKIPRDSPYASVLTVGATYTVFFDQKGRLALFQRCDK